MDSKTELFGVNGDALGIDFRQYDKKSDEGLVKSTWINSFRLSPTVAGVNLKKGTDRAVNVHTSYTKGKSIKILHSQFPKEVSHHCGNPANPASGLLNDATRDAPNKSKAKPTVTNKIRVAMAVSDSVYFFEQRDLLAILLDGPTHAQCFIACSPENPDDCYGWICFDVADGVPVVHYMYVKKMYASKGLAQAMLRATGIDRHEPAFFTHSPPPIFSDDKVVSRWKDGWTKNSAWTYNPYILTRYYERLPNKKWHAEDPGDSAIKAIGELS